KVCAMPHRRPADGHQPQKLWPSFRCNASKKASGKGAGNRKNMYLCPIRILFNTQTARKSMKRYLLFLAGLFWLITAEAQTQSKLQDVSKVRVEQLSDQQVLRLITEAEKRGLDDGQLILSLGQRGLPAAEQQKLRQRIAQVRQQRGNLARGTDSVTGPGETGRQVTQPIDSALWFEPDRLQPDTGLRIFGSELFRNRDIRFEPNLNIPTPKGYVIGAGDQLELDLTGDNVASYELSVTQRSEERRVGKECRSRRSPQQYDKRQPTTTGTRAPETGAHTTTYPCAAH